jgi:hypothetical protein
MRKNTLISSSNVEAPFLTVQPKVRALTLSPSLPNILFKQSLPRATLQSNASAQPTTQLLSPLHPSLAERQGHMRIPSQSRDLPHGCSRTLARTPRDERVLEEALHRVIIASNVGQQRSYEGQQMMARVAIQAFGLSGQGSLHSEWRHSR